MPGTDGEQAEGDLEAHVLTVRGGPRDAADDQADPVGLQAQAERGTVPVPVRVGAGDMELHAAVRARHGEAGLGADRGRVLAADPVHALDHDLADHLGVAEAHRLVPEEVAVRVDRRGGERLLRVGQRLQRLVADQDGRGGQPRGVRVVGGHGGHRLAVVPDEVGREHRPVLLDRPAGRAVGQPGRARGQVGGGDHGVDAGDGQRGADVHRDDPGVGVRGRGDSAPEQPLGPEVGGVGVGAERLRRAPASPPPPRSAWACWADGGGHERGGLDILTLAGALGCGLNGGVFFAWSTFVMDGLRRAAPPAAIAVMQSINRRAPTPAFMLLWLGTGLVTVVLAAWTAASGGDRRARCSRSRRPSSTSAAALRRHLRAQHPDERPPRPRRRRLGRGRRLLARVRPPLDRVEPPAHRRRHGLLRAAHRRADRGLSVSLCNDAASRRIRAHAALTALQEQLAPQSPLGLLRPARAVHQLHAEALARGVEHPGPGRIARSRSCGARA